MQCHSARTAPRTDQPSDNGFHMKQQVLACREDLNMTSFRFPQGHRNIMCIQLGHGTLRLYG
jgi:hypothetical protein